MIHITDRFARRIREVHGVAGGAWLQRLPGLIADCERRWSLKVGAAFEPLSHNYVAPATRADGTKTVLKIGVPTNELSAEIEALRHFAGRGSVRLLDADPDWGALLLERVVPGTPLTDLADDDQATLDAAQVMRQLWHPVPPGHSFASVADWAAGLSRLRARFGGTTGPLPAVLVDRAERLFAELVASMGQPVLLHGDLHHENILAAQRQPWLAIDPKGVTGEPEYEVGALLRNPMPQLLAMPHPEHVLARRMDILAESLGFDRGRLRAWGLAQAVLAAWWSIEDHGQGWETWIACAALLDRLQG